MKANDPIERLFGNTPSADLPRGSSSHQSYCFADPKRFRVDTKRFRLYYVEGLSSTTFIFARRDELVMALQRFTDALATLSSEQEDFVENKQAVLVERE